jgi:hypothetical protein
VSPASSPGTAASGGNAADHESSPRGRQIQATGHEASGSAPPNPVSDEDNDHDGGQAACIRLRSGSGQ